MVLIGPVMLEENICETGYKQRQRTPSDDTSSPDPKIRSVCQTEVVQSVEYLSCLVQNGDTDTTVYWRSNDQIIHDVVVS